MPSREVQRQRPARLREGQESRVSRTEALEHGHERGGAGPADPLQRPAHHGLLAERHHELVLAETRRAVHPVPVPDPVQRMEERTDGLDLTLPPPRGLAVPDLVGQPDRDRVQQPAGEPPRGSGSRGRPERKRVPPVPGAEVAWDGEVAAGDHGPAQSGPAGEAVGPGHGVAVTVVGGRQVGHGLIDVSGTDGVHRYPRGLHRRQLDGRGQDDAGQAHPAGGGPEQPGIILRRHPALAAVRQQQVEPGHVLGEAARDVVVLAVHVRGDRPAHGHLPGPGRHWHEPASGEARHHQLLQADPASQVTSPVLASKLVIRRIPVVPMTRPRRIARRCCNCGPGRGRSRRGPGRRPAAPRPARDRQARPAARLRARSCPSR